MRGSTWKRCLGVLSLGCASVSIGADAPSYELWFFIKEGAYEQASSSPRFSKIGEHPCGFAAKLRLDKMPSVDDPILAPDLITEFQPQDGPAFNWEILRQWVVPIDTNGVASVTGDRILIRVSDGDFYAWISTAGEIERASEPPPLSQFLGYCPGQPELRPGQYEWSPNGICYLQKDGETGRIRWIASYEICT